MPISVRTMALCLFICTLAASGQEKEVLSNRAVMQHLVIEAADHLDSLVYPRRIETGRFLFEGRYSALNYWVASAMRRLWRHTDSTESKTFLLSIDSAGVDYSKAFRKGLWGEVTLERNVYFALQASLCDTLTKEILVYTQKAFVKKDTIQWSDIALCERGLSQFSPRPLPMLPGSKAWFKALLLSASFGGLAILFYIIRSR